MCANSVTATAEAGDNSLVGIDWEVNDSKLTRVETGGETGTDELTRSFEPGTYQLSVRVVSELDRTNEATLTVNVTAHPPDDPPGPCSGASGADDGCGGGSVVSDTGASVEGACRNYDGQTSRATEYNDENPTEQFGCIDLLHALNDVESGHGFQLTFQGKTGQRTVTLIPSVPYLQQWLSDHPARDDPDASLWCKLDRAYNNLPSRRR